MKNKLFALLLCLSLLLSCVVTAHADSANDPYTVAGIEALCDGIVAYKETQSGVYSAQDWIDTGLCDDAGISAEYYIITLSQRGSYDFSSYKDALLRYIAQNEVYSATTREKYALALIACGSTDRYIADTADEAIGGLGLMSLVFGLHILNNGYTSSLYSTDALIGEILSYRKEDGGWAVIGSYGDVDVTAMTIQALAPHYGSRSDVRTAVDDGLALLSRLQQDSGGFKGMGVENCESTAQVLTALSALGIDAQYDGRFIKNGNSVLDGMLAYRNDDGSFAHTGGGFNETATMEALYAMTAYLRMCYGQSPLYILDNARPVQPYSDAENRSSAAETRQSGDNGTQTSGQQTQTAQNNANNGEADNAPDDAEAAPRQIVTVDGRQYIAATDASGEDVTISIGESVGAEKATEAVTQRPTYGGFQPSATADQRKATADENTPADKGGYKPWAILGVLLAAGLAAGVLFLLKKRGKKHYIAVAIIAAAGILFVLLTDFQSVWSYHEMTVSDGDGTVTMTIRCDTISGFAKVNEYIPDDGVILSETEFSFSEGDTVFDVLLQAPKQYGIAVDNHGAQGAAYIAGINFLYEFDYGDLSGWMYRVNGVFPDVGCQSCYLHDGDRIEWLYTTNIGKDLD